LLVLATAALFPSAAEARPSISPMAQRRQALRKMIAAQPQGLERHFAPSFLKRVPAQKLIAVFKDYYQKAGPVVSVQTTRAAPAGKRYAEYRFICQKGSFPVKLGLEAAAPHRITMLWVGVIAANFTSLEQAVATLKRLPGTVSFALWQLGRQAKSIAQLNPDASVALGLELQALRARRADQIRVSGQAALATNGTAERGLALLAIGDAARLAGRRARHLQHLGSKDDLRQ